MRRLTRRSFLETVTLAGAGVAVHGCGRLSWRPPSDAIVLGAGIAGLTAARELVGAGLDVLVLEARDKVGGRIETLHERAAHGVEIGAQMIHGSRTPMWELIREFDINTRPMPDRNRWPWNAEVGFHEPDPAWEEGLEHRLADAFHTYRGEDISYQAFLDALDLTRAQRSMATAEALSWTAEPDEISLRATMEDGAAWETYLDQDFQVVGGLDLLTSRLREWLGDRIRLSCTVQEVEWERPGVRITYERDGRSETIESRRAIVTLPIGVLQSGRPVFTPELPGWKRRAIDALGMGRVVVVPLLFRERFWRDDSSGMTSWWMGDGRVSFWDPHPEGVGEPALQAWVAGRAAQELSDLGSEAGVARTLAWIEKAFPRSDPASLLEWSAFADWVADPHFLGSYSYTRPGGHGQRAVLATPIQDRLYFAGEATAAAPQYQTVHGAHSSGRRVAREIFAALGLPVG